jgi:hypothetical protein
MVLDLGSTLRFSHGRQSRKGFFKPGVFSLAFGSMMIANEASGMSIFQTS